ncbi:hypothetical protein TG4357_02928 [Thalassovita gelatinovora]|uniref:Uncharacterized protein n=1 Tax=Thalassovita gelatinovora TaxID=53501 RepID=A0A0P1FHI1_THAGE|nr:hypothetical protein TG4357_02928 [Thalassovita gelatinovora]SEP76685.1 hypothetical protein SAMN04488043_101332 [Thalassovita gelatinovora]
MVRDLETGDYAAFRTGVAVLHTEQRNRVRVEFAPQYAQTKLSMPSYPAAAKMTLVARCSNGDDWLKGLFSRF